MSTSTFKLTGRLAVYVAQLRLGWELLLVTHLLSRLGARSLAHRPATDRSPLRARRLQVNRLVRLAPPLFPPRSSQQRTRYIELARSANLGSLAPNRLGAVPTGATPPVLLPPPLRLPPPPTSTVHVHLGLHPYPRPVQLQASTTHDSAFLLLRSPSLLRHILRPLAFLEVTSPPAQFSVSRLFRWLGRYYQSPWRRMGCRGAGRKTSLLSTRK
jgi:hypothetical protein